MAPCTAFQLCLFVRVRAIIFPCFDGVGAFVRLKKSRHPAQILHDTVYLLIDVLVMGALP